jgi:hypothetical protein
MRQILPSHFEPESIGSSSSELAPARKMPVTAISAAPSQPFIMKLPDEMLGRIARQVRSLDQEERGDPKSQNQRDYVVSKASFFLDTAHLGSFQRVPKHSEGAVISNEGTI